MIFNFTSYASSTATHFDFWSTISTAKTIAALSNSFIDGEVVFICSYYLSIQSHRHLLSNYRSILPLSLISCSFYIMQIQLVLPASQLVAYPLSDPPQKHIFFWKFLSNLIFFDFTYNIKNVYYPSGLEYHISGCNSKNNSDMLISSQTTQCKTGICPICPNAKEMPLLTPFQWPQLKFDACPLVHTLLV